MNIGCLPKSYTENDNSKFFITIPNQTKEECQTSATKEGVGSLCNGDSKIPCAYFARDLIASCDRL